jgi:hypothetical protein
MDVISGFWEEEVDVVIRLTGPRRIVREEVDELQKAGKLRLDTLESAIKRGGKDELPEAVQGASHRLAIWTGRDDREGLSGILQSQRNLFAPPQEPKEDEQGDVFARRHQFTDLDVAIQNRIHGRPATAKDAHALLKDLGIEFPLDTIALWSADDIQAAAEWAYGVKHVEGYEFTGTPPAHLEEAVRLLTGNGTRVAGVLSAGGPAEDDVIEADYEIVEDTPSGPGSTAVDQAKLREALLELEMEIPAEVTRGWSEEEREEVEKWAAFTILDGAGDKGVTVPPEPACIGALELVRTDPKTGVRFYASDGAAEEQEPVGVSLD